MATLVESLQVRLDHIIIFLTYKDLTKIPDWLSDNFTISPGGRHADSKTENKLILFADGSYIELIAFIDDDPKLRDGHWWGDKMPGQIADIAFTTDGTASENYEAVQKRLEELGLSVSYAKPVHGARVRPDGVRLEWEVTFPVGLQRGQMPFFCHDITPRSLRVPRTAENVKHPCGAHGLSSLMIVVPSDKEANLHKIWEAILGTKKEALGDSTAIFKVGRVDEVESTTTPSICVHGPKTPDQASQVAKQGVFLTELVLGKLSAAGSGSPEYLYAGSELGEAIQISTQKPK